MLKVMITGASGFLGLPLVKELSTVGEYEIIALYNKTKESDLPKFNNVIWQPCDLLDEDQVDEVLTAYEPKLLFHMAWNVKSGYQESESNFIWLEASIRLAQTFDRVKGEKLIIAGTCFEYGGGQYFKELEGPFNSTTLYGAVKYSLYNILRTYKFKNQLKIVWGRIFNAYGPREHPSRLIPSIINGILDKEKHIYTKLSANSYFSFMHVDEIARIFVSLGSHNIITPVNIIWDNQSLLHIINLIETLLDNEESNIHILNEKTEILLGDNITLWSLGLAPKLSFERGLVKTINYWKKKRLEENI